MSEASHYTDRADDAANDRAAERSHAEDVANGLKSHDADVIVQNTGSIFLFHPQTDTGRAWIEEHLFTAQFLGDAAAVEHRYARDIADGMQSDGLVLA